MIKKEIKTKEQGDNPKKMNKKRDEINELKKQRFWNHIDFLLIVFVLILFTVHILSTGGIC